MNRRPLTISAVRELIVMLQRISDETASVQKTADWLHLDTATVYRWVRHGKNLERLPGPRPTRITTRSILRYLQNTYHAGAGFNLFDEK